MIQDEPRRHPVEGLAQSLILAALADPALLARSKVGPVVQPADAALSALGQPPGAKLHRRPAPSAAANPELEELVAIAVACARRAEDASREARAVGWMARRRMSVVAAVTGAAVLGGAGIAVLDRHRGVEEARLGEVASAVRNVGDLQRRTAVQLAEMQGDIAVLRDGATTAQYQAPANTPADSAASAPKPAPVAALGPLPPALFVEPHPYPPRAAYNLPARATYDLPAARPKQPVARRAVAPAPPIVLAAVFADLRRNLQRVFP